MKRFPSQSAAAALLSAAATVRMFWGMSVDHPIARNASWLCPLLGFIMVLPFIFSTRMALKLAPQGVWQNLTINTSSFLKKPFEVLLGLLLLYDAAVTTRLIASSSNIIALGDVTVHFLIVPLGIVIGVLVLLGLDAAGNSALVALRALPLLLVILLVVQLKRYELSWLTPVLGDGVNAIISGSIYCAGNLALLSLIYLPTYPDRAPSRIMKSLFLSAASASLLLACLHMSYPVMPEGDFTQAARIELILSNGRMSLSPQFLLNILWFGGLLYLLAAEVLGAAVYIKNLLPNLPLWALALLEALAVSFTAIMDPFWLKRSSDVCMLYFPLIGAILFLLMLAEFIRRRGHIKCLDIH